jgi:hypothetical protein
LPSRVFHENSRKLGLFIDVGSKEERDERQAEHRARPRVLGRRGALGEGHRPLKRGGYDSLYAVENPLTSLADDVGRTRTMLEQVSGPVLLVGHSYGGAVITELLGPR